MRILRLAAEGFGPFRERFDIDFTGFDDGVYLIAGPTGAGKSSILDAIVYALYGSVPRYEFEQRVRSDLAAGNETTEVQVDVQLGDREIRVIRSPSYLRPKARGEGTTTVRAKTSLFERVDGQWVQAASTKAEAGSEIQRMLGLTRDEFLQVILLAQGRFTRFLHATSAERKELLRRLCGTDRFERLRAMLVEDEKVQRAAIAHAADERSRQLDRVAEERSVVAADAASNEEPEQPNAAEWLDKAIAAIAAALTAAQASARDEAQQRQEAERALESARAVHDRQARRATLEAERVELEAATERVELQAEELRLAENAADAAPLLDAWRKAADAAVSADEAQREAVAEVAALGLTSTNGESTEGWHDRHSEFASLAGALESIAGDEARLPALEQAREAAHRSSEAAFEAHSVAFAERTQLPAARDRALEERSRFATAAADEAAAEAALTESNSRLAARAEAIELRQETEAERAETERLAAEDARASEALLDVQARRIAGFAGELAGSLRPGEPCAVCGGTEHPAPASAAGTVDAAAVDEAMAKADAARAAHKRASEQLNETTLALTAAETRAGPLELAELEAEVRAATERRDAARTAREAESEATRRVNALDARIAVAESTLKERAASLEAAGRTLERATTELTALATRVESARGDAGSVAERLAEVVALRDALGTWMSAIATAERTQADESLAREALDQARTSAGFVDDSALAEAIRSKPEREALRSAIEAHSAAVAGVRRALAQPDLQDIPEAPDLAGLEAEAEGAASRHDAAAGALALAERSASAADTAAERARAIDRELATGAPRADVLQVLAASLDGKEPNTLRMDIETFVLAARLESIVAAANVRLQAMTGGRFSLVHDDALAYRRQASGLGIRVLDSHTGLARPTESLSGGESFLASLSLALGLADTVQNAAGGLGVETLFIDEGFGALDAEALESALAAIDALRAGGRSVGIISHVQQMQDRIPARIRVVPIPGGGSRVVIVDH